MTKQELIQTAAQIASGIAASQQTKYNDLSNETMDNIVRTAITLALRIESEAANHVK